MAIVAVALGLSALLVTPASASTNPIGSSAHGLSSPQLDAVDNAWLFGSNSNPIDSGICGEVVSGYFLLNAAVTAGNTDFDCTIPVGTPVLASAGGAIVWAPTNGNTDEELLASVADQATNLSDPLVVLDRKTLPSDLIGPHAYTMPLGENSLIREIDPGVPAEWTQIRVASTDWLTRLTPLTPGAHTIVESDRIDGDLYQATFHIQVVAGRHS